MAAVTQILTGFLSKLYRNTGTYGTPTWTAQTEVKDVKPQAPWGFAEAVSRAYNLKLYAKTLLDLAFQVVMRVDPADAQYEAWLGLVFERTTVFDLLILNGAVTVEGTNGFRGEFLGSLAEEPQEIEGTIYATFDLKPTLTANGIPEYATVGSDSSVTFTAFGD